MTRRGMTLLAATHDGVLAFNGGAFREELQGHAVTALAPDGRAAALAVVDEHAIYRRSADGTWQPIARSEHSLACCVAVADAVYAGTDDAHVLHAGATTGSAQLHELEGFRAVPGRDRWYAGTALVDGQLVGPPLGVRSITATADGAALLANVHVGGIARSTDGGATWQPTIDIDNDVHEVRAHPSDSRIAAAAAATGLCVSRDGGATWTVEQGGLHAAYCSAVAFAADDVLVAASADHFAAEGAVYRRSTASGGELTRLEGGFPEWTAGIVDTAGIASRGQVVAVADQGGNLYVSEDAGRTWSRRAESLPWIRGLLVL